MSTAAVSVRRPVNPDRVFFPILCALILITVWIGFSKTYYAAGMVRAKLPSTLVHVHAVAFSLWLLTLIVQIGLVTARKVKLHMTVGLWGFALAAVMVVLGWMAALEALGRGLTPPGFPFSPTVFLVIPLSDIVLFAVLAGWSYLVRRKPQEHKRLIMIATILLTDAAFGRFPSTFHTMSQLTLNVLFFGFLVAMMAYDFATLKKVHRVTWMASLAVFVVCMGRIPFAQTVVWQKFVALIHG